MQNGTFFYFIVARKWQTRVLPKIDIGDYLVIHDAGAHGFSMGYNYNGKLKSEKLIKK